MPSVCARSLSRTRNNSPWSNWRTEPDGGEIRRLGARLSPIRFGSDSTTTKTYSQGALAWANSEFNLAPGGEVHLARVLFVSGDVFRVLGVQPVLGRVFTAAE